MKAILNRKEFLSAIELAYACAPRKSPKLILTCVLIDTRGGVASVMATDLEVSLRVPISGVEVDEAGVCVCPAKELRAFLKASSEDTVRVVGTDATIEFTDASSTIVLPGEAAKDYPVMPFDTNCENCYTMPANEFGRILELVEDCADTESSRYALGGAKLEHANGHLLAIATDGKRLAKAEFPVSEIGTVAMPENAILPLNAIKLIHKVIGKSKDVVSIAFNKVECFITSDRFAFSTRLVEGRFPRWRDVINGNPNADLIELPVGQLRDAINRIKHAVNPECRGIDFTFAHGGLLLSAGNGAATSRLSVSYAGENGITLDCRFVLDCLAPFDKSDSITLRLRDEDSCSHWHSYDCYSYAHAIMPMARDRDQPRKPTVAPVPVATDSVAATATVAV